MVEWQSSDQMVMRLIPMSAQIFSFNINEELTKRWIRTRTRTTRITTTTTTLIGLWPMVADKMTRIECRVGKTSQHLINNVFTTETPPKIFLEAWFGASPAQPRQLKRCNCKTLWALLLATTWIFAVAANSVSKTFPLMKQKSLSKELVEISELRTT